MYEVTAPHVSASRRRSRRGARGCAVALWLVASVLAFDGVAQTTTTAAQRVDYTQPVGVVNGETITRGQLAEALIMVSGHSALEVLIKRTLITQQAVKMHIKVTPEEIDRGIEDRINDIVRDEMRAAGFRDEKGFADFLAKKNITLEAFRARVRASLSPDIRAETESVLKAMKLIEANVKVSDDDIRGKFDDLYGPKIYASQIVMRTRREAEEVLRKLRQGVDFERLAKVHSIDRQSGARGGRMSGSLRPADKPLWDVAASLEKGGLSSIVRTQYGYHILKVDDVKGRRDAKLEDVRDEVVRKLYEEKRHEYFRTWYVKLLEKSDVRKMLEPPSAPKKSKSPAP